MGSEQAMLPGWESAQESYGPTGGAASESEEGERARKPRFEPIEREQLFWRKVDVERLIGEEHAARAIWESVASLTDTNNRVHIQIGTRNAVEHGTKVGGMRRIWELVDQCGKTCWLFLHLLSNWLDSCMAPPRRERRNPRPWKKVASCP